jgi:hypothetical protein
MTTLVVNAINRSSTWDYFFTLLGPLPTRPVPRKSRKTGGGTTLGFVNRAFLAAQPIGPTAVRPRLQPQLPQSPGYVLCGVRCATSFAEMAIGPVNRATANSLARRLLGREHQMKFRDGLRRTADWYFRTKKPAEVAATVDQTLTERMPSAVSLSRDVATAD